MGLPTFWLSIAMALACVAQLALASFTLRLPAFPGRRSFIAMLMAMAWWETIVAIEHASPSLEEKVFWAEMAWLGIIATPGAWVLFIWNYINGQYRPAPRMLHWILYGLAILIWLAAITNSHHHLLYAQTFAVGDPPSMTVNFIHGPLYFGIAGVFYTIIMVSEAFVVYEILRARPPYRIHFLGLGLASLPSWFLNMGYATKLVMIGTADLTPLSFVFMNVVFLWLISRRHMFDLLPIAQGMLLDSIPDPVVVLDGARHIVAHNPAARRLIGGGQELRGRPLAQLDELRGTMSALDDADLTAQHEIAIGTPPRYYDIGQVPLLYGGREVGRLIQLRDVTHRKATEDQLQSVLADLEKQLLNNVALQEQLREEAIRDALTGLHNRRFFGELAPVMLAEAQRNNTPLSAAMIDIDHFKRLNDTHGHAAGDAVLRATGAFLRERVRQSDVVLRMGGEEFLILLPRTAADQALKRVDDWRAAFAAKTIEHEGATLSATFSAGVAAFPADAADIDALLNRADQALYRAKTGGRNKVEG